MNPAPPAHTPGPWYVNTIADQIGDVWSEPADCPVAMAQIVGPLQGQAVDKLEVRRANARLIAAAPDLLAALEAWMEFNRETSAENPCPDYGLRARLRLKAKELSIAALSAAKAQG